MALQLEHVNQACEIITRQVRETYRNLSAHFIVYHGGQLTEAMALSAQEILSHPAAETALHIMRKRSATAGEDSSLMGTAVARENILFGLASREAALALCGLNVDEFDTLREARRHAYHLAWHAIDSMEYHTSTRDGTSSRVIIRKRNALHIAAANLRADAFSGIMCSLQDDYEAIRKIAQARGLNAITRRSSHTPEYYPFAIAAEATEFAAQQLRKRNLPKKKLLAAAIQSAHEIGKTFDDILVRQWLGFSQPAQDMAWRGFERDEILSAAINTSHNTYIRAAGYMISELTNIDPASIFDIRENYSPFADDRFNEKLHQKLIEKIFEDVIAEGLKRNSSDPFFEVAEKQNQDLTEGHVVGWCAAALQESARAFDAAIATGGSPAAAARRQFDEERERTPWENLKALGKSIVRHARRGKPVTMSTITEIADDSEGTASIVRAVQNTIKNPGYRQKLEAVNDLAARPAAPQAAPKAAPAMSAPTMAAPVAAPSFGPPGMGGGRSVPPLTSNHSAPDKTRPPPQGDKQASSENGDA